MDPNPVIHANSTVPYAPLGGSPSALVRSQDGQYVVVSRDQLHLLTPRAGTARWSFVKTVIQVDKKRVVKWADWVDDAEVATVGQVDPAWRSATFSPAGGTVETANQLGTAALATLTTNGEVAVFEPKKDAAAGEWTETSDLTAILVNDLVNPNLPRVIEQSPAIRRTLAHAVNRVQATAVAWSGPVPSDDSRGVDGSILAVGHRSGEVSLWRYGPEARSRCVHRFRPKTDTVDWITLLKWSRWRTLNGFTAELAIGDADGRVWTQTVTQRLRPDRDGPTTTSEGRQDPVEVKVEESRQTEIVAARDRRHASQFCWVDHDEGDKRPTLAFTKLGTVHVVKLSNDDTTTVDDAREFELDWVPPRDHDSSADGSWTGSTSWSNCCGIVYSAATHSLRLHLSSGLVYDVPLAFVNTSDSNPIRLLPSPRHTRAVRTLYERLVSNDTTSPEGTTTAGVADPAAGEHPTTTTTTTTVAPRKKKARVSKHQGPRFLGVVALGEPGGGGGRRGDAVACVFDSDRPDSLEYRVPSTVRTHFAVANLAGPAYANPQAVLDEVGSILAGAGTNALHAPPHQLLMPLLDSVSSHASASDAFVPALVQLLASRPNDTKGSSEAIDRDEVGLADFESSVFEALYATDGARGIERLRNQFTIVERLATNSEQQLPRHVKRDVERVRVSIERELIRTVVSRLANVLTKTKDLSESEKPFLTRLLLASSALPPIPFPTRPSHSTTTTSQEGGGAGAGGVHDPAREEKDAETLSTAFESSSRCPACQAPVPFANVRTATCTNGHTWERCSITLEVIARVDVKTCSGSQACRRKALSRVVGTAGMERVNRVLAGVTCCAYCGGRWMKVR
ncbi:hypothetical protein JCM11491_000527 [Sporobolomyces phaffii]